MKFKALALAIMLCLVHNAGSFAEEYDSRHTVLALNMAIVSVQRIINTSDRIALDMEYKNIINNLKLGNIESDKEIIDLYQELLNVISAKTLSQEAAARLQEHYNRLEREVITKSLLGIRAAGPTPLTFCASLAVSCVSQYFKYRSTMKIPQQILDEKLYRIDVKERESYNVLQTKLLKSSWRLMRLYELPDEYRITQDSVNDLFKAVNEDDSSKSLSMLKALEDEFRIYPPYWVYRAKAAQSLSNESEAAKCFDEFDRVWRPVLRNDPFKVEAAKYRVTQAMKSRKNSEALSQVEIVKENTPRSDWANNLFAGAAYFMLGEKEKGINCIEVNVNFDSERELSGAVLAQMKSGNLNVLSMLGEQKSFVTSDLSMNDLRTLAKNGNVEAQLLLGKMYADGEVFGKDYGEAVKWFERAALEGNEEAQNALVNLYFDGGPNLRKNYYKSYVWCCVCDIKNHRKIDDVIANDWGVPEFTVALLTLPISSAVYALFSIIEDFGRYNTIKDDIEGAGVFVLAKLSSEEMDRAKREAEDITKQIVKRIKKRQQTTP